MIAVLHDIRSAHNVGSIFRTADAAGVEKIFLCGITPGPLDRFGLSNPKVTKVSLGAEHTVAWERVSTTLMILERLKKERYFLMAVEQAPRSCPYYQFELSPGVWDKTVLVLGNEIDGIPTKIIDKVDKILEIPMRGKKESLNVAVAFGIVAFHLLPERG